MRNFSGNNEAAARYTPSASGQQQADPRFMTLTSRNLWLMSL